ncbi:restriction endonuclease subunit S [Aeromonas hydrophila]|uniref:Restriction endonuclease subunit S n=1 Tax=Aeromonas hydrophila TaxID=644 RepID=A0A926ITD9_AERHY|nr:restriction endonuclease subunit S [Aeromonas hydrophila]
MLEQGAQPNISSSQLERIIIRKPTLEIEQKIIANVLSDSDALIDALEQLIAKKQAIKSGTMQQLLTGRTRLPAFALRPDGTKKATSPANWEIFRRIGRLFH